LGPSEEAEAEFAKELAKMVTDSSTESRKVDKKTALAMWDSAVLPPGTRKKRADDSTDEGSAHGQNGLDAKSNVMNFTVVSKRGNKQNVRRLVCHHSAYQQPRQTRQIAVPAASAIAVHTRSAQLQDKVEQQHLKRLVLDYEQREEADELKGKSCNSLFTESLDNLLFLALEARHRTGAIKVRYVG
jgi:regulator of nonsense transcripts 2